MTWKEFDRLTKLYEKEWKRLWYEVVIRGSNND